ncbi:E3 ubiquitin-protein ligase Topors-like isoform X1 [Dysidea avara]|uniref:E3 ubiquitin-protein ligase Topors-like isoform X1 n=1 Tax=Dysidea avara TaxID=196820 RepID=UPI00332862EF
MEDEKNSSDENVAPAAKAVEAGCPICLESFKDKAFVDVCFHTFCYSCILQWADVVSSCPMCKAPFKSIIHNVRSTDSYDQHDIKPKPVLVSQEVSLAEARRFWYRTTRLSSSKKSRTKSSPSTKRSVPKGRNISAEKRRRAIYAANLWVKPFPAQDGVKKVRETTPKFFKSNPAASHRLIPWLTREFKVILGEEDSGFVVALINSLLDTYDIASPEFAQQLQPFLFEKTAHFVHEFVSFARAPCDMVAYDEKAEYDVPPDGAPLPELVPIENDEPGPSGLNQKYFDEAVQDGKRVDNSPTMKQHCDEDDDSGSVSSRHDKDQEKKQVETRGDKSTVHSRDNDNRSRYDGSSSHRQKYSERHDSRDRRHDSRDHRNDSRDHRRDEKDGRRRHSHLHRSDGYRRRNYSSGSSTERHSKRKRRYRSPSSGSDRGHGSKYSRGSDRYSKHSRRKDSSSRSGHRRNSSSGKRKHRHYSSDSGSSRYSSPTRHTSNKKVRSKERKGSPAPTKTEAAAPDSVEQAPDEVLQQELVNLEEQINVDKKMLLKNLLRKERLALLHDSIDKEQLDEDESLNVSDNKLKEELQHLDEAITTGKTALISVMKRISSTDSTHDATEQ